MFAHCPLCQSENEAVLWRDARCRVILMSDADYPGYCRVIWQQHVKEMTDLTKSDRAHFMSVVLKVEYVLRDLLRPEKINLASLGNQVPHLHWHVIPRFIDDAHFPDPIWATRKRGTRTSAMESVALATHMTCRLNENLDEVRDS
ncbi:MAG: HIT family protein [Sulfuricaulis sp.]